MDSHNAMLYIRLSENTFLKRRLSFQSSSRFKGRCWSQASHLDNKWFKEGKAQFKEFKPRPWSSKNWFQLSTGSNLETLNTISSGANHMFEPRLIFEQRLKFCLCWYNFKWISFLKLYVTIISREGVDLFGVLYRLTL